MCCEICYCCCCLTQLDASSASAHNKLLVNFFLQNDLFSALSKSGLASLTCNEDIVPRYYLSCPTPDSLKLLGVKCMGEMLRADRTFILFYSCLRCCQRLRLLTISCDLDLWEVGDWGRWSKGHCTKGSPFLKYVVVVKGGRGYP